MPDILANAWEPKVSAAYRELEDQGLTWDDPPILGSLRGGCSRGGGKLGTLTIPRDDWGTLGDNRED